MGSRIGQFALGPLGTGIAYLVLALGAIALSAGVGNVAIAWPPSGLMLAVVLLVPRGKLPWHVASATAASFVANLIAGSAPAAALGYTIANLTEMAVAAALLRRGGVCRVSFVAPQGLFCFAMASLLAAASSTLVAALVSPGAGMAFIESWFVTVLLGMFLFAPPIVVLAELPATQRRPLRDRTDVAAAAGSLLLVTLSAALAFGQDRYPVQFLPMMAMMFAVLRWGVAGAVLSVGTTAIIGTIAMLGHLPRADGLSLLAHVRLLQLHLVAMLAAALPMAMLLATRTNLRRALAERVRLLDQSELLSGVGHWRVEPGAERPYWSPAVFAIHGLPPGTPPPLLSEAIDFYHPDDRERVSALVGEAIETGVPFRFESRLLLRDGSIRHVVSQGERDFSSVDGAIGLFGLIQDVTEQIEARRLLDEARRTAERAAEEARHLAETDMLTCIANRRSVIASLDRAIDTAARDDGCLAIALFDLDHFKSINDGFGHAGGDAVLRDVARVAAGCLRHGDSIGRIGGEEFLIVLAGADRASAERVAERVRLAIEQRVSIGLRRVTISAGVATMGDDRDRDALLERADRALYAAKAGGRNRWCMAA
ncbi:sensor domain-containing diguanylate cyclase [Sphingomonas baiyangensis]|uniref:diguanylate cyclase n=1 Tax=Sphingomonas baiyangensis TaxID=2572576 RepID=A0A4U1L2J5_9SPHN|nr:sensor domain-containing diguanylate cyclase [Sphingomonas baiyangensis]TKD51101.1 diguanylate cyclase [Sphingomonas baiyangensis]